jgi:hypothetical protein
MEHRMALQPYIHRKRPCACGQVLTELLEERDDESEGREEDEAAGVLEAFERNQYDESCHQDEGMTLAREAAGGVPLTTR